MILDVNGTMKNVSIIFHVNNLIFLHVKIHTENLKINVNGTYNVPTATHLVFQNKLLL